MTAPPRPDWIAVDWGTSNLRAWAMAGRDRTVGEAESALGMSSLPPEEFEAALLDLVEPWLGDGPTDIVACGMVGSRQGWVEAPYAAVPCPPRRPDPFARAPAADRRLRVHVLHGLKQESPADVMRGEETQIAGLVAREPGFEGVACLPGTHSKWAHVSAGEVVSFASFMTGELFHLLATASVLRHSVAADGWSDADFDEALDEALARPERLARRLFSLRAEALLHGLPPDRARARLSGLLIGAELAAARPYWLGRNVALIGAAGPARAYADALARTGVVATVHGGAAMTRAGLAAAHDLLTARKAMT